MPATGDVQRIGAGLRVVVAGGGMAALRCCEQLRRAGFAGTLTVLGAEPHQPYDRPPLSKAVLLGKRDETTLPVDLAALDLDLRLGRAATGLSVADARVHTDDGPVGYDGLVIATGASPVRLPGGGPQQTLRTVDDALRLRASLRPGARVVVIGASWIGAEVSTAAATLGCTVTCLELGPAPLALALGADVGARLAGWWADVDLRCGTSVGSVEAPGVVLADGAAITADVVVTGVGVRPETGWLAGSGLDVDRGVLVDEHLRAAGGGSAVPRVVAVGDVSARWSPRRADRLRIEHWDEAATGPAVAARTLLYDLGLHAGPPPVHDPVPYFWSDQWGHKVQYVGHRGAADSVVWREPSGGRGWSVAWLADDGRLTALMAVDRPRELIQARRAIDAGATPDPARLADPDTSIVDA